MTKIEWTDETWNPVTGCTKVSAGCKHCYAEGVAKRFWGDRAFTDVRCHPDRLGHPIRWRKPRRVFVNSMSDLFHEDVPDGFITLVFAAMAQAPWHTFQVLTKRPERALALLPGLHLPMTRQFRNFVDYEKPVGPWPLPHVWLGVSVEDQDTADERIPLLLQTPAAQHIVSLEPMLGAVDLSGYLPGMTWFNHDEPMDKPLDWVIVGGESGPKARPMHPEWARTVRDQCVDADVPFFFKQWGEWAPSYFGCDRPEPGTQPYEYLKDPPVKVWRFGKKGAGRQLDGREWDEYPGAPNP